jgi:hypothetical protein
LLLHGWWHSLDQASIIEAAPPSFADDEVWLWEKKDKGEGVGSRGDKLAISEKRNLFFWLSSNFKYKAISNEF